MIVYPAIDIQGGVCVRLVHGRKDSATVFNSDPAGQARRFYEHGFTHLHVVDLDGAFAGSAVNAGVVRSVVAAVDGMQVQLGGGIRTRAAIDRWLQMGLERVILGTLLVDDPALVRSAAADHKERIWVGIDARDGIAATNGWEIDSRMAAVDLALRAQDCGVGGLIVTDIGRDGIKSGVNLDLMVRIAEAVSIPVIASGGVSGIDDISCLARSGIVAGVIVGRALYDGSIDPAQAVAAAL